MNKSFLMYATIILLFFSCKNQEKASRKPLEGKKAEFLIEQLNKNAAVFETFSAKADFTVLQKDKKTSFKANIRIKKDSIIWISISPALGIEMARVLITQDTVKVINRLQKEYFIGDYNYLNKRFNVELNFQDVQALLLGSSVGFETDERLKFGIDNDRYYLGNMKKRRAKKADSKPEKVERKKDEVLSLWLDKDHYFIRKFLISDLSADRFLLGNYDDFIEINDQRIPQKLSFTVNGRSAADIKIDYSRVSLNESLSFSFKISSKYEQVLY